MIFFRKSIAHYFNASTFKWCRSGLALERTGGTTFRLGNASVTLITDE